MGITNQQDIPERPKEKVSMVKRIAPIVGVAKSIFIKKEPLTSLTILSVLLTIIGELFGRSLPVSWYVIVGTLIIGSFFILVRKKEETNG